MPLVTVQAEPAELREDGTVLVSLPQFGLDVIVPVDVPERPRARSGDGASYARGWKRLPPRCLQVLTAWYGSPFRREWTEKGELRRVLGVRTTEAPFMARISELVGCGVAEMSREARDGPHETRQAPAYRLDVARAGRAVASGGSL